MIVSNYARDLLWFIFLFFRFIFKKSRADRFSDCFIKRNMYFWNWIQKVQTSENIINKKKKISEYSCIQKDETAVIKVEPDYIWI
jgi:hypothetical protein